MCRKVVAVAAVVECVGRQRFDDCFVIDLATSLEKIQVEMFVKRFTYGQDAVAMSLHTQWESPISRHFVLLAAC
jgi:hypothetical protein